MKKSHFYYLILIFLSWTLIQISVRAQDFDDFDFDDFDFDDFIIQPPDPKVLVVATLKNIVEKPLWERTNIPNGRDVLYLMPYKITNLQSGGFFLNLFFNSTNRMKVTFDEVFNRQSINISLIFP